MIDILLVLLLLVVGSSFMSRTRLSEKKFEDSIVSFEEDVQNQEVIQQPYITIKDDNENTVSKVTKSASDTAVKGIEVVVHFFGELFGGLLS